MALRDPEAQQGGAGQQQRDAEHQDQDTGRGPGRALGHPPAS
jgi:hypothetical protein